MDAVRNHRRGSARLTYAGWFTATLLTASLGTVILAGCSAESPNLSQYLTAAPSPIVTGSIDGPTGAPALVAMPAIVGAPQNFTESFVRQLNESAVAHNIALLADATVPATFTLRGYFISDRDAKGIKVSYVWDVLDKTGTRISRIAGEERVASAVPRGGDIWAAIPADVQARIVERTMRELTSTVQPPPPPVNKS